jgi:hypothetical protein
MTKNPIRLLSALLLFLLLAACGKDNGAAAVAASTTSPDAAVMASVKLLKAGDFNALAQAALPPADYQQLQKKWSEKGFGDKDITDEDRQKFNEQMAKLTAPGAEDAMFKEMQPSLAEFNSKYKAQLPMYVGMGQTMAGTAIDQSKTLDAAQKQQAKDVLAALAQWVQTTDWADQDKARQAIAVVCDTARKLDLKTLDQASALSFEQAMQKYGQVWAAARKIFALYGFDVDATLDSINAKTVSNDGTHAVVATSYTLFGKPMTSQTQLVQRDGRWYNKNMLESFEKDLAEPAAAASGAGAAAGSR